MAAVPGALADNRLVDPDLTARVRALPAAWRTLLSAEPVAGAITRLSAMLADRIAAGATIYPVEPFRALTGIAPSDVRVVILGQDPYHGPGQAQGLAFSVPEGTKRPPSLRNILAEIERTHAHGSESVGAATTGNDLSRWVEQGVLLLNTALTVEDGQPGSHARAGWETVTDALIAGVAAATGPTVFMLWGAHAQAKRSLLPDRPDLLVLTANHPSPLSARRGPQPFVGCGHFSIANAWLQQQNCPKIHWKQ